MNHRRFLFMLFGAVLLLPVTVQAEQQDKTRKDNAPKFELLDGDRVVFLGNTLIEREQKYGYWETMLTARYPERNIIFRNLGWDGDTVWADSRGIFDPPAKGYQRMLEHVGKIKPTVIFLGYGNNEAFAGKKGLPAFVKQYNKLIDDLKKVSAKNVRFVILSPIRHADFIESLSQSSKASNKFRNKDATRILSAAGRFSPMTEKINEKLEIYSETLQAISRKRGSLFVDLFTTLIKPPKVKTYHGLLTNDGIHLIENGYRISTVVLEDKLYGTEISPVVSISLTADGKSTEAMGASVDGIQVTNPGIRFKAISNVIPFSDWHGLPFPTTNSLLVRGLSGGPYALKIDGREVARTSAKTWSEGIFFAEGPDFDQSFKLRQAIVEKNQLYFYSWRPQNVTYLFLFRKHEQGQNAKEVEEFLKLVAEKEQEIARLKKPVTHTFELIRVKETKKQ